MERKKNPKADLESKKGIFILIGLIISLSLSILAYESKSYDNLDVGFGDSNMDDLDEEDIDITRPEPPPPPKEEPPPPPEIPEEIEIKENEEELENEVEVDDAETDQEEDWGGAEEVFEEAYTIVEQMPLLGDCKDEECTQNEIMKFIIRNFKYPEISKANGVEGKVVLSFTVEKTGKIDRIEILRGLDKYIDKAAIEAVEKLNSKKAPKFLPGRQIGRAVPVKYTVPIKCTLG